MDDYRQVRLHISKGFPWIEFVPEQGKEAGVV